MKKNLKKGTILIGLMAVLTMVCFSQTALASEIPKGLSAAASITVYTTLTDYAQRLLDSMVENGIITEEQSEKIKAEWLAAQDGKGTAFVESEIIDKTDDIESATADKSKKSFETKWSSKSESDSEHEAGKSRSFSKSKSDSESGTTGESKSFSKNSSNSESGTTGESSSFSRGKSSSESGTTGKNKSSSKDADKNESSEKSEYTDKTEPSSESESSKSSLRALIPGKIRDSFSFTISEPNADYSEFVEAGIIDQETADKMAEYVKSKSERIVLAPSSRFSFSAFTKGSSIFDGLVEKGIIDEETASKMRDHLRDYIAKGEGILEVPTLNRSDRAIFKAEEPKTEAAPTEPSRFAPRNRSRSGDSGKDSNSRNRWNERDGCDCYRH